jgi:hypothetical protein
MKPTNSNIYECVVLNGLPTKAVSNSDSPPNSYHTGDLFVGHPTIPNAWKFVGRSDDRVTLLNGEKVLPLPMEGSIVQNSLVKEAVIFGNDRSIPGLMLFQAKSARGMTNEEYLDLVWPTIETANSVSEAFAQIGREMVIVIADDVHYPLTDKGSVKRAQLYRDFESIISKTYNLLEDSNEGTLFLEIPELELWIIARFKELGISLPDARSDFFAAGVDSLKAIQMRGIITKSLDLRKGLITLPSLIVYDCGNTQKLASFLRSLQTDAKHEEDDAVKVMTEMIRNYSMLPSLALSAAKRPEKDSVVS